MTKTTSLTKSLLGGLAFSVALATASFAAGVDVNASSTGLAMQGFDPVAYFTEGEANKGSYKLTATHDEATYWFTSEENKALFEANPEAYCPLTVATARSAPQWASNSMATCISGRSPTMCST